jgi:D-beta-D-heptose 7-phosphate kinase/D-beta-D-heptose 1-phosphate adenosyltransferase
MHTADHSDKVVVGINSDASVSRLKGATRPLVNQDQRALMLAAFLFVDAVVIFDQDTPLELIGLLLPDLLVKGGDWAEKDIVGADLVRQSGGDVQVVPYLEGWSTSNLAHKLTQL